jgi:DNA-binding beta-propeller fold protein YncE
MERIAYQERKIQTTDENLTDLVAEHVVDIPQLPTGKLMTSRLCATVFCGCTLMISSWLFSQTAKQSPTDRADCQLCFYGLENMVFDEAGAIYITDTDHKKQSRILKLSMTGKRLDEWHLFQAVPGKRSGPEGIAIDRAGNLYVTDAGARSVLKLSPAGKILMRIGGDDSTFQDLGHVAVDSSGCIYVAEGARNLIQKFGPDGRRIANWKRAKGSSANEWGKGPETIALRRDGTLAVEDWGNHRIIVLSISGDTVFSFGTLGDGPGQFTNSAGLAVDSAGNIYVADWNLHRVQEFDPSGRLLSILPKHENDHLFTDGPQGVAVDRYGDLYAPDGPALVKFSPDGKVLARWK